MVGIFVAGFFAGVIMTLGVLALISLRWLKRKEKKISSHHLDVNRFTQRQG